MTSKFIEGKGWLADENEPTGPHPQTSTPQREVTLAEARAVVERHGFTVVAKAEPAPAADSAKTPEAEAEAPAGKLAKDMGSRDAIAAINRINEFDALVDFMAGETRTSVLEAAEKRGGKLTK